MRKQCKACPWKVSTVPERDIPGGYCAKKHRSLKSTIAEGYDGMPLVQMACHEFPIGKEQVCVGWLANQLGPGNNIGLRLRAAHGLIPPFLLDGAQHETFEDTLPIDWGED